MTENCSAWCGFLAWFAHAYSVLAAGKTLIAPDALLPVEDMGDTAKICRHTSSVYR